jgi:DNA-binding NarL/FixJ family response regulator
MDKLSELDSPKRAALRNGTTTRILIVDDSAIVRANLSGFVALFPGIEVVGTAADGAEAVRLVADRKPDLVLMDLQMPFMDGLEAMRLIHKRHQGTRVILMTMAGKESAEARCLAAGADAFLCKQDIHRDLAQTIGRLFPQPSSASSSLPVAAEP